MEEMHGIRFDIEQYEAIVNDVAKINDLNVSYLVGMSYFRASFSRYGYKNSWIQFNLDPCRVNLELAIEKTLTHLERTYQWFERPTTIYRVGEKEKNMMKKMFQKDLKPGYVVKLRNGELRMLTEVGRVGSFILVGVNNKWDYVSHWNNDMTATRYLAGNPNIADIDKKCAEFDIMEVYGPVNKSEYYGEAGWLDIEHRPLLWQRNDVKKMTVSEISKALGYEVEIIAEK